MTAVSEWPTNDLVERGSPTDMPDLHDVVRFAAVDEPGVDAILGTADQNLIPVGGDVMLYGDGGTGKTTLAIDLAFHLATGLAWLGVPVAKPARVLLIENEGPRPLFRRKLARKLAGWAGYERPTPAGLYVWTEPWGSFTFTEKTAQAALARHAFDLEIDLVIAGPLTQLGMLDAGTLAEVRAFSKLVADVRAASARPVAFVLVHHESKGGRVSGAWEGATDTMLHLQSSGAGRARLYVQKARWGSEYHARAFPLEWTTGDSFAIAAKPDPESKLAELALAIETYVLDHPGASQRDIVAGVTGKDVQIIARVKHLLGGSDPILRNLGTPGGAWKIWHRSAPDLPVTEPFPELLPDVPTGALPEAGSTLGNGETLPPSGVVSGTASPLPDHRREAVPEAALDGRSTDVETDIEW